MLSKILACLLVLSLGLAAWEWNTARRSDLKYQELLPYVASLENAVAGLKSSQRGIAKADQASQSGHQAQQAEKDTRDEALNQGLQAAPDWADQPVPDSVRNALGASAGSSPDPAP